MVKRSNLLWLLRFFFWSLFFFIADTANSDNYYFGRNISPIGTVVRSANWLHGQRGSTGMVASP
jgi:hypothetical protein